MRGIGVQSLLKWRRQQDARVQIFSFKWTAHMTMRDLAQTDRDCTSYILRRRTSKMEISTAAISTKSHPTRVYATHGTQTVQGG